ncbi:hypothetical protein [Peribacillus frigoritolerans]|uniref:hypothetical protein n=1 Tax=Peribacillus frigoritolerans TaxID=450367 RepID=UPI000FD7AA6D|nr:hypothetical protein [Peribacillus frigoritolerans]AZV60314.1 hypothetical protein DOZ91_06540 [Peribacillus frigoritolerans]
MDIHNEPDKFASDFVFGVSITYKERGTINNIFFDLEKVKKEPNEEVFKRLKKAIDIAKENVGKYSLFKYTTGIKSMYSLSAYEGERFKINVDSNKSSKISILVESYDRNQGSGIATKEINQLMDFLSVETNAPFWNTGEISEDEVQEIGREIFQEDDTFIDGLSYINGHLVMSKEGKQIVEKIVNLKNEDDKASSLFLKASNHFHTARKYHAQFHNII